MPRSLFALLVAAGLCACNACSPRTVPDDGGFRPSPTTAPNGALPGTTPPPASPTPATPPVAEAPRDPGPPVDPNAVFTVEPPPTYRTFGGVRIAAFNTEFLFDGTGGDGQADFPWKDNPAAARQHRDQVGAVIRALGADVVMLVEVENRGVLDSLVAGPLRGLGYAAYFVQGSDSFTGQDMGLLSKIPVTATGRTDERAPVGGGDDTYGVSKNLWARLTIAGVPTTLIGVHLLAMPDNTQRKPQREAQAEVIRRLAAAELAAGRAVVVMGDLNDFDEATPDVKGSQPITDVLATIKRAGPAANDDLRNVLAEVPQARRFTNFWDRNRNGQFDTGEFSAIDHVLLSPALYGKLAEVSFVHSHDPRLVSDHFPIVVTLR